MPGSYQRLDLFIKVLRVLCPNLTDASKLKKEKRILWKRLKFLKEFILGSISY